MELADYLALPENVRAEWVDGVALVMTPADWRHQGVEANLVVALKTQLSGVFVVTEGGVRTRGTRFRIGDVAVVASDKIPDGRFAEEPPLLIVEVSSPSTRSNDTVRKSHEYWEFGVGQYWILDREAPALTVFGNTPEGWEPLLELDTRAPTGSVAVGDHGTVELDLDALLAT